MPFALEQLVAGIGQAGFKDALFASVNALTAVDHYALVCFDCAASARLVSSASCQGFAIEPVVQEEYLEYFQRLDPNRACHPGGDQGGVALSRMRREAVPNPQYRQRCSLPCCTRSA